MSAELKNIIEAVLLAADSPLNVARIQGLFERDAQPSAEAVKAELRRLQEECAQRGVELRKIGNGYRYQTRRKYADWVGRLHAARPPKMSRALLETLAIIAYRQPVTRGDIEEIRGVGVTTEIIRRLLEREWVKEVGVRDQPGHPALFATTAQFLAYFNLESIKELPPLSEERELGEIAGEMDTPLPAELLAALRDPARQSDEPRDEPPDDRGDGRGDGQSAETPDEAAAEPNAETARSPEVAPPAATEQAPTES